MAHCGEERNEWFCKLPMSLLAIRTTLKPDIGASPADLVYGEGLAVPGDLLPQHPSNTDDLEQERRRALANLRVEVSRLQPKQTSAHRQPLIHVPEDLNSATHVFVRRGGINPPLTTPYEGPYPVHSRTQTGIKVELPGRGVEEVALARLRPAYFDNQNQPEQQPQHPQPPAPPPPAPSQQQAVPQGHNLTRLLDPATRVTRQNPDQSTRPTPAQPTAAPTPRFDPEIFDDDAQDNSYQTAPADTGNEAPPHQNPFLADDPGEGTSRGPTTSGSKEPQSQPKAKRVLSFSNPKPGNFSYRRRRPDVNALREIMESLNS